MWNEGLRWTQPYPYLNIIALPNCRQGFSNHMSATVLYIAIQCIRQHKTVQMMWGHILKSRKKISYLSENFKCRFLYVYPNFFNENKLEMCIEIFTLVRNIPKELYKYDLWCPIRNLECFSTIRIKISSPYSSPNPYDTVFLTHRHVLVYIV